MLSVVVPALNAAARLPAALAALGGGVDEVVVADGGSTDDTRALAVSAGARIVDSARGRGVQLAAGAHAARGDWLMFLHADTVLAPGWSEAAGRFMADHANTMRAGYFRFALDAADPAARLIERLVAWRCRFLALPYGDQGSIFSRALYDAVGGFRPLPLMEDVDMVRRLGRARLVALDATAVTSADRYLRDGWLVRPARNLVCLSLYFAGVRPERIARLYG